MRRWRAGVAFAATAACAGCGEASTWTPPAPAGTTYQYALQGYAQKSRGGFGGVAGGRGLSVAGGGAFTFRQHREVDRGDPADPFEQMAPIDGVRFNEHLAGRGIQLEPGPAPASSPPSNPPLAPAPSASPPAPGSRAP